MSGSLPVTPGMGGYDIVNDSLTGIFAALTRIVGSDRPVLIHLGLLAWSLAVTKTVIPGKARLTVFVRVINHPVTAFRLPLKLPDDGHRVMLQKEYRKW